MKISLYTVQNLRPTHSGSQMHKRTRMKRSSIEKQTNYIYIFESTPSRCLTRQNPRSCSNLNCDATSENCAGCWSFCLRIRQHARDNMTQPLHPRSQFLIQKGQSPDIWSALLHVSIFSSHLLFFLILLHCTILAVLYQLHPATVFDHFIAQEREEQPPL